MGGWIERRKSRIGRDTYLEGILAGEALTAVVAGEGLDSQVNALMTLQVVIAAERLDALIALEGALRLGRSGSVAVDHLTAIALVVVAHAGNHGHLAARLVHVGHHSAAHGGQLAVGVIPGVVTHAVRDRSQAPRARASSCGGRRLAGRVLLLGGRIGRELRRPGRSVVAGIATWAGVGGICV